MFHSLQHTMQSSFQDRENDSAAKLTIHPPPEQSDLELEVDKHMLAGSEMVRLFETAISPIFAVDSNGYINKWNLKIAELTGLPAIGKSLVDDELLHEDSRVNFRYHFSRALQGEEDNNIELRLKPLGQTQQNECVFIVANAFSYKDYANNIVSVWFIGQDITEARRRYGITSR